jgi:trans-aconitate methyltransferase
MFNFALNGGKSYLDLGCGFGRFLQFLTEKADEPDYIGYDSSEAMISRINERFPDFFIRTFHKDVTTHIAHPQEVIISSAIFIHITLEEQQTILDNILALRPLPKAITFDINSPSEVEIDRLKSKQTESFERLLRTTKDGKTTFRMTWQSHYIMTERLIKQFAAYNLTTKFYDLQSNRHKVVYMLEKK